MDGTGSVVVGVVLVADVLKMISGSVIEVLGFVVGVFVCGMVD